jgi:hypothetical protein
MATRLLDCAYPSKIKRIHGYPQFGHSSIAELGFGQEFRLIVLHKLEKPSGTSSRFVRSLCG